MEEKDLYVNFLPELLNKKKLFVVFVIHVMLVVMVLFDLMSLMKQRASLF
jgi:hypothetical protein